MKNKKILIPVAVLVAAIIVFSGIRIIPKILFARPIIAQLSAVNKGDVEKYLNTYPQEVAGSEEDFDLDVARNLFLMGTEYRDMELEDENLSFYVTGIYPIPMSRRIGFEEDFDTTLSREDCRVVECKIYINSNFLGNIGSFFGFGKSFDYAFDVAKIDGEWKVLIQHPIEMEKRILKNVRKKNPDFPNGEYSAAYEVFVLEFCILDEESSFK